MILYHSDQVFCWSSDSQNQKPLMYQWDSFLEWGNEHGGCLYAYKIAQFIHFEWT